MDAEGNGLARTSLKQLSSENVPFQKHARHRYVSGHAVTIRCPEMQANIVVLVQFGHGKC